MHTNSVYSFEVVCMKSREWCIMCIYKYILLTSSPFCDLTSLIRLFLSTHGCNELCSMFILWTHSFLYLGFLLLWIMCRVKPDGMGILKIWRVAESCCIFWECTPTHVPSSLKSMICKRYHRSGGHKSGRDLTHIPRHKSFPVLNSRHRFLCIFFHLQNVV